MLTLQRICTHLSLIFFCASGVGAAWAEVADHHVGLGDERRGYESKAYVSQTQALKMHRGKELPLAELAQQPILGLPDLSQAPRAEEVALGKRLFFDRRLSANGTLSCGMCHIPEQGFTQNELATPVGIEGQSVRRNTPTLYNVVYHATLFWDGRERALDEQIWAPLLAANEMGNKSRSDVVHRLRGLSDYDRQFADVYASGLTEQTLGAALAAYQSVLRAGAAPFDRWFFAGESDALNDSAKRGFEIFVEQGCSGCHQISLGYALFTDDAFHNTGIGFLRQTRAQQPSRIQLAPGVFITPSVDLFFAVVDDYGREEVTGKLSDRWRYRTPSLRNVALTAPYMHDGSLPTLDAVIDFYDRGGGTDPRQDPAILPLHLSKLEHLALLDFLKSLTGANVDKLASDARSVEVEDIR
jgi:cytochrome c peroxidase